jgi:hypothetical protein
VGNSGGTEIHQTKTKETKSAGQEITRRPKIKIFRESEKKHGDAFLAKAKNKKTQKLRRRRGLITALLA